VPVSSPGPSGTRAPPDGGDKKIRKTGFGFKGTAKIFGASFARQANSSAPAGVKVTKVPDSVHLQPAALDREFEARAYSAGLPRSRNRNGSLIFSMWMRP
jgi:hypothetical protein